ncbi:hypothetical protein [Marinicellulosiphila megalodicopiae]|uniref:hypothetical protein n=1 Tax=Marinicellulosiphila megalodicopiae TaxID=2724896 RepID=UPI003BB1D4C1
MKNYIILALCIFLFSCNADQSQTEGSQDGAGSGQESQTGKGGSTTRFTIVGDFLYVVENNQLKTFNIADDIEGPKLINTLDVSDELETIFPYAMNKNTVDEETVLLLGAINGMHIYKINSDGTPNHGDQLVLTHARSCDPVIAQNGYAYVTLRGSSNGCSQGSNELQVLDISQIELPSREKIIPMDGPKGLSFSQDGNALLICDKYSLKVFSLINPIEPEYIREYLSVQCDDILQFGDHYIATGTDLLEIYTFDSQTNSLKLEKDLLDTEL